MTPALMSLLTRRALASLPAPAQREFTSWLTNKLQILSCSNSLEAEDATLNHVIRGYARQRNRAVEICLEELAEIFEQPNFRAKEP